MASLQGSTPPVQPAAVGRPKGEASRRRLRRLRTAARLGQSQLARKAGVPLGTLKNWEQGRREPLLGTAARVAKALGCTLDELAGPVELPAAGGPDRPGFHCRDGRVWPARRGRTPGS